MTNWPQLDSLSIDFLALSSSTVKEMDTKNIKMKHLKLGVEENEDFQSLKSLEIGTRSFADSRVAYRGLFNLFNNLNCLTHLTIKRYYTGQLGLLFHDILQNLMALEELVFQGLGMRDRDCREEDCTTLSSRLDMVKPSRLKSLCLGVCSSGKEATVVKRCNLLVQYILKSCPLLEMLQLYSTIHACGVVKLNFSEHVHLKRSMINLHGARYYTFHHHPGKYWKNIGECISEEEVSRKESQKRMFPHYINLAWMVDSDVQLEWTDCKASRFRHYYN